MSTDRWERLQSLFHQASELGGEERRRLIRAECAGDPEMEHRLLAMLAADEETRGGGLDSAIGQVAGDMAAGALSPGEQIGSYRVIRELGRGGMGAVHLAERVEGDFEQEVALKILGGVIASPRAVERFLVERRILAQLSHPSIARLIDGGTTPQGAPWFAMERVEGEPIDEWCDRQRLSVRDRLVLFLTVCEAVQYAHGRLIVHRDLKPSNILVTRDGSPKLLDFGIAKLLEPDAGGGMLTRRGEMPMTPEYASPEQVKGQPVTTATDVYQLGLLLYELLTGRRAHRLSSHQLAEIERVVCEEETPRPSSAVLREPDGPKDVPDRTASEIAAGRGLSPEALRRHLRGDLDTIVQMAVRREPERRYASVQQLADDIRRHLDGLPVAAHRDSLMYRTRKLVVRRAGLLASVALITLALVAGLLGTMLQARRAGQEARRAEEVTEFLTSLLEDADPDRAQGRDVTVREVLDRAARTVEVELESQPRVQATLQALIGRVYGQMGLYQEADTQLTGALERLRGLLGDRSAEVASAMERLALMRLELGRAGEAERLARESLEIRRELLGPVHPDVAGSLIALARVKFLQGAMDEGRGLLDEALAMLEEAPAESEPRLAEALHTAARIELQAGDLARAEALARRELEARSRAGEGRTRGMALALDTLASVLSIRGEPEQIQESEAAYLKAIGIERALLGDGHPVVANLLTNLAGVRARKGDFAGGERAFLEARESMEAALGPDHPELGYLLNNLAVFYHRQGRFRKAIEQYQQALDLRQRVLEEGHPLIGTTRSYLGLAFHKIGDPRAEATYRRALDELLLTLDPDNQKIGILRADLGLLLAEEGRYREAESELRSALEILEPVFGGENQRTDSARAGLGLALCGLGRPEEAAPLLQASRRWRQDRYPEGHWRHAELGLYEAECLMGRGRRAEAAEQVDAMKEILGRAESPQEPLVRLAERLSTEASS